LTKPGADAERPLQFPASFAADVKPDLAAFMADSQVPGGMEWLDGKINTPGLEDKAKLVLNHHGGQNDSGRCAATAGLSIKESLLASRW
jgi:hypothetical protein